MLRETVGQIYGAPVRLPEHGRDAPGSALGLPQDGREITVGDLAFVVAASFRRQPHINNVLTHISGANWERVEQALCAILDPLTISRDLAPLARNIVDLMCADRGVTGRILKPYFCDLLARALSPHLAALLTDHVSFLFLELELGNRLAEGIVSRTSPDEPFDKRGSQCRKAAADPRG